MENQEELFDYNNEEAAKTVLQNISKELKDKLEVDDVVRLMELKEEYFKIVGIYREEGKQSICTYPIELNEDEMNLYIISNAVRFEIILSVAQMVGSVFYLTQNSLSIWRR